MAGVLVNQGEQIMLEAFVNKTAPQPLRLKLYKNNITPAETDIESTYTEATFTGYADIALTAATWTTSGTAPTAIDFPEQSFTSTANQTAQLIYGYYYTQQTSGKLTAVERFADGPYSIANNGDVIKVTPHISQD